MATQSAQDFPDQSTLVQAFGEFNQNSGRLTDSYQDLQIQVNRLRTQIARTSGPRNAYLTDQLNTLLELLPVGVILVDSKGRIDRFNESASQLIESLSWGRRWPEIQQEALDEAPKQDEWRMKTGKLLRVIQSSLVRGGHILVLVDITEERQLEAQLQHQQRLSAMGEMVARMAHQVRTPLSTAILYAGQITHTASQPQRQALVTEKLLGCLRHIEAMVGEMLNFSRQSSREYASVDLQQVLQKVNDGILPRLEDQDAKMLFHSNIKSEARVVGSQDALVAVLLNLVENAVQHGGQEVAINVVLDQVADGFLIQVSDDGPGIPNAIRERIFEPFYTTNTRGTGLGLTVAKTIVKEHGGVLECCNNDAQGACFLVWLPAKASSQDEEEQQ